MLTIMNIHGPVAQSLNIHVYHSWPEKMFLTIYQFLLTEGHYMSLQVHMGSSTWDLSLKLA